MWQGWADPGGSGSKPSILGSALGCPAGQRSAVVVFTFPPSPMLALGGHLARMGQSQVGLQFVEGALAEASDGALGAPAPGTIPGLTGHRTGASACLEPPLKGGGCDFSSRCH